MALSPLHSFARAVAAIITLAALAACGFGSSGEETPSNITPDSTPGLSGIARTIQVIGGTADVPAPVSRSNWHQAGGRADHDMRHAQFADSPTQIWSFVAGDAMSRGRVTSMEPLIDDGVAYTLSWDQTLSAIDLSSGQARWQQTLLSQSEEEGVFGGGIALMNQTLFAATGAGELHSVSPETGSINWTVRLSAPSRSGPLAYQGKIYVTDILGTTTAFSPAGVELWQQPAPQIAVSVLTPNTPAAADNGIYQVLPNGVLRALLPSGQDAWQSYIGVQGTTGRGIDVVSGAGALPIVDDNFLLVSSWATRTAAITASTGELIWEIPIGSAATPLVTDRHVFLVTKDGYLRAIQRRTGYQVWSTNLGPDNPKGLIPALGWQGPILAGGNLIVGTDEGALRFIDPKTGTQRHELHVGSPIVAPLSLANETLLVTTRDGLIRAFR